MSNQQGRARERLWMVAAMLVASFVGGAATHLSMAGTVSAQGGAGVVTATQVNLVDGAGRLRGVLAGSDPGGLTSITLYDQAGLARSTFAVEPDGTPVLQLHGPGGEPRLQATVQGNDAMIVAGAEAEGQGLFGAVQGRPIMTLGDGSRVRLQLHLTSDGLPRMVLAESNGREAASVAVGSDDMPQLALTAAGRRRAVLTAVGNATVLNLGGAAGTRLVAGVSEDGAPSIIFLDGQGNFMASLGEVGNGRLGFVNAAGEVSDVTAR
jgi:hypothetical protein